MCDVHRSSDGATRRFEKHPGQLIKILRQNISWSRPKADSSKNEKSSSVNSPMLSKRSPSPALRFAVVDCVEPSGTISDPGCGVEPDDSIWAYGLLERPRRCGLRACEAMLHTPLRRSRGGAGGEEQIRAELFALSLLRLSRA